MASSWRSCRTSGTARIAAAVELARRLLGECLGEAPGPPILARRLGLAIGPGRTGLSAPPPTWRPWNSRKPAGGLPATCRDAPSVRGAPDPVRSRALNERG